MHEAREGRMHIFIETGSERQSGVLCREPWHQHSDLFPSLHPQMWMSVRQWCVQEKMSSVKTRRVATAVSVLKATDRRTASA